MRGGFGNLQQRLGDVMESAFGGVEEYQFLSLHMCQRADERRADRSAGTGDENALSFEHGAMGATCLFAIAQSTALEKRLPWLAVAAVFLVEGGDSSMVPNNIHHQRL